MVKTYLKGNKLCRLAHRVSVAPLLLFPVSATLSAGNWRETQLAMWTQMIVETLSDGSSVFRAEVLPDNPQ
jgi:hypothetical protein